MRFSSYAHHRREGRKDPGLGQPVKRISKRRITASMVGMAMVSGMSAGAAFSSAVPVRAATSVSSVSSTVSGTETSNAISSAIGATNMTPVLPIASASASASASADTPATVGEAPESGSASLMTPTASPTSDTQGKIGQSLQVQANAAVSAALTCQAEAVFTLDTNGSITRVSTPGDSQASTGTIVAKDDTTTVSINGLALTSGANYAYAVRAQPSIDGDMTVYRYEAATGITESFPGMQDIVGSGTVVLGGINPATGVYYYGRVSNSRLQLYAFNTLTNTNIGFVGSTAVTNDSGFNGGTARANGDPGQTLPHLPKRASTHFRSTEESPMNAFTSRGERQDNYWHYQARDILKRVSCVLRSSLVELARARGEA